MSFIATLRLPLLSRLSFPYLSIGRTCFDCVCSRSATEPEAQARFSSTPSLAPRAPRQLDAQDAAHPIHIIVVDDGSPESCRQPSRRRVRGCDRPAQRRSQGFAAAANQGIRAATSDIIQLLNDDTQVEPGWLDAPLRSFRDPTVAAVAPLVLRGVPGDPNPTIDRPPATNTTVAVLQRRRPWLAA